MGAVKTVSHQVTPPLLNSNRLHISGQPDNQLGVNIVAIQGKTPADLCQSSSAWRSLSCARNTVAEIPAHRFEQSAAHGALYGHFVDGHHTPESTLEKPRVLSFGWCAGAELFDPQLFSMSITEVCTKQAQTVALTLVLSGTSY